jgi:putative ATP-dependent endonuclease of OLD family
MVEGDAENLFLPTFAEFIGIPLHKHGISIVNVGSTALLRYAKIFLRADSVKEVLDIPVAVVTDLDIKQKIF